MKKEKEIGEADKLIKQYKTEFKKLMKGRCPLCGQEVEPACKYCGMRHQLNACQGKRSHTKEEREAYRKFVYEHFDKEHIERITELEGALEKYGQHLPGCLALGYPTYTSLDGTEENRQYTGQEHGECTCGLEQALKGKE